jgi:hypothetical protein
LGSKLPRLSFIIYCCDNYCWRSGVVVANEVYDVFVSYSRADWRHAADIDSVLRAKGLKPFFDRRNLPPGLPWVRALEEAIGACKAAIVLVGPRGFGNTQQYERDLAFFRQTRDPILPQAQATIDRPFNFLQILTWIDFSHVAKVSEAPAELEHLLTAGQGGRFQRRSTGDDLPVPGTRRIPRGGLSVLLRPRLGG